MYRYSEAIGRMVRREKFTIILKVFNLKLLKSRKRVLIFLAQHLSSFKTGNMYSIIDRKIKIGLNTNLDTVEQG